MVRPPSVLWWAGRLVVEGAAGAAAVAVLKSFSALSGTGSAESAVTWVLAGVAAPRLIRAPLLFQGRNLNVLALVYDRLRGPFDAEIDDASADAQGQWVERKVMPAVRDGRISAEAVAEAFRHNIHGRRLMSEADQVRALQHVDEVMGDTVPDDEKVGTLVLRAQQLGTYRSMKRMVADLPPR